MIPPTHLHVIVLFGGVDVLVPESWQVRMDLLPVLGDAEDERGRSPGGMAAGGVVPDLVVKGFVAFGGFSIKS